MRAPETTSEVLALLTRALEICGDEAALRAGQRGAKMAAHRRFAELMRVTDETTRTWVRRKVIPRHAMDKVREIATGRLRPAPREDDDDVPAVQRAIRDLRDIYEATRGRGPAWHRVTLYLRAARLHLERPRVPLW